MLLQALKMMIYANMEIDHFGKKLEILFLKFEPMLCLKKYKNYAKIIKKNFPSFH